MRAVWGMLEGLLGVICTKGGGGVEVFGDNYGDALLDQLSVS